MANVINTCDKHDNDKLLNAAKDPVTGSPHPKDNIPISPYYS